MKPTGPWDSLIWARRTCHDLPVIPVPAPSSPSDLAGNFHNRSSESVAPFAQSNPSRPLFGKLLLPLNHLLGQPTPAYPSLGRPLCRLSGHRWNCFVSVQGALGHLQGQCQVNMLPLECPPCRGTCALGGDLSVTLLGVYTH